MFIKEMCRSRNNEKSSRIFRPWDLQNQDATVSTTTEDEVTKAEICEKECDVEIVKTSSKKNKKQEYRPNLSDASQEICRNEKLSLSAESLSRSSLDSIKCASTSFPVITQHSFDRVPAYTDYSLYPELIQANLTQNLGITPNDPLLLESLANGYALEEYARVLEQEHQAKFLNSKKKRPKKYKCPHCDVGFSNNGQLKGHIRIHTGERPFKCDEKDCGKTFTRNEELTRHKRIHSGLRPFPCAQCGKRFGRKDHLKKHCRTHFQPRGFYAVPVMLPYDAWASNYPFVPSLPGLY